MKRLYVKAIRSIFYYHLCKCLWSGEKATQLLPVILNIRKITSRKPCRIEEAVVLLILLKNVIIPNYLFWLRWYSAQLSFFSVSFPFSCWSIFFLPIGQKIVSCWQQVFFSMLGESCSIPPWWLFPYWQTIHLACLSAKANCGENNFLPLVLFAIWSSWEFLNMLILLSITSIVSLKSLLSQR